MCREREREHQYGMWKSIFNSQWDILCVVEHKEHAKSRSSLHHKQYHVFYAGVTRGGGLIQV